MSDYFQKSDNCEVYNSQSMNNIELMSAIKARWGSLISEVCASSSVPECLMAALIANESWGKPDATRFEPGVFNHLKEVQGGARPRYGNIRAAALAGLDDGALRVLATSYGLTQIMGYNAVYHHVDPLKVTDPEVSLPLTIKMLAEDAQQFGLDLASSFTELLTCWNAGNPKGHPVPGYVHNGLTRAQIYSSL
jgi:hypothetical protein